MGSLVSKTRSLHDEKKKLAELKSESGESFPGSDYRPCDRKNWMSELDPNSLIVRQIIWPGTHDSATNKIGIPLVTRPFARCQSLSIYDQLSLGTRCLDIRVEENRRVCHGILSSYSVDVVIADIKRFMAETESEIIILEIRTEFGHNDPPDFDKYLVDQFGDLLVEQDEAAFGKTIMQLLPRRIICVWKPRKTPAPKPGDFLWSARYLKDNWIDTDLPLTKFESNMKFLGEQPPSSTRNFFYRVENTVTPKPGNPEIRVKHVNKRIRRYARLFISQCFVKRLGDRLQVISVDFIDKDFVDACVGLSRARLEGSA